MLLLDKLEGIVDVQGVLMVILAHFPVLSGIINVVVLSLGCSCSSCRLWNLGLDVGEGGLTVVEDDRAVDLGIVQ